MQEIIEFLQNCTTKQELALCKLEVRIELYQLVQRLIMIFG